MKKRIFIRPVTLVVSEQVYQKLTELTHKTDCSLSEWIRDAINMKLRILSQQSQK